MSDRPDKGWELYPYARREDGQYDLARWNEEYWERFARMLQEAAARDIVVQIEIWDRFDFTDSGAIKYWQPHPYNPRNNVNYTSEESGLATHYPDHPGANKQPFFFTTPAQRNNRVLLPLQERFVARMLDIALRHDNVLYCIDNETNGEEAWSRYWAEFVQERAAAAGKQVQITEMWDDWNLEADRHKRTFDHPELYSFVDVSQNNHNRGRKHWEGFQYVRDYLAARPRPINTIKTYGATGNKFGHTDQDGVERLWRHLLGGAAAMRFHRPDSGLGLNDRAVACLRAVRLAEQIVPLWTVRPAAELVQAEGDLQAYAASDFVDRFLVYLPQGGAVVLQAPETQAPLTAVWIDIDAGSAGERVALAARDGQVRLEAPDAGNWAVAIVPTTALPTE
jgi:hypothetical protein